MKKTIRSLALLSTAVLLAACSCPQKKGPAGDFERTAGSGMQVWSGKCHQTTEVQDYGYAINEERTAGTETVKKPAPVTADKVFRKSVRK